MKKEILFFKVLLHKKFIPLASLFLCFGMSALQAQQVVTTSGGNATGGGGSVSYSIGQIVYTKNSEPGSGSVAQGVQQPYEISVVTGLEETLGISLEIKVYPNPSTDFLKLIIMNFEPENLSYQLYNINGNLIQSNKVESSETTISTQDLLSATYFLKIIKGNRVVKTFKIIKNK